jgi:ribosomal protein S18 acetylase RimI-like enzyme
LSKLPERRGFILCQRDGGPAGVAVVSRVGSDAAVDCVLTLPRFRRAGVARSIMQAAEVWAAGGGVQRLVLSVVDDNTAAITLYRSLGYRRLSGYHYRTPAAA